MRHIHTFIHTYIHTYIRPLERENRIDLKDDVRRKKKRCEPPTQGTLSK